MDMQLFFIGLGIGLVVFASCITLFVPYGYWRVEGWGERQLPVSGRDIHDLWDEFSRSGENPLAVIGMAVRMTSGEHKTPYQKAMLFTSSYYSQIKFLLRRHELPMGIVFFLKALSWSKKAMILRRSVPVTEKDPIDLEILGAPYFMLIRLPLIGWIWRRKAVEFLVAAEKELKRKGYHEGMRTVALPLALVMSKLWKITKNSAYVSGVKNLGIKPEMDADVLRRIADHLGFQNVEEIFK